MLYHHDNEVSSDSDYRVILPKCFCNTVQIK
nr:MAG TPA: MraZ protein [Caudoviricetes sp.]